MMTRKLTPAREPRGAQTAPPEMTPVREGKPPKAAKAPSKAASKAGAPALGALPLRLSGLFATGGLCVGVALVGALTGTELLLILGAVLSLCVMAAGAVLAPSWLDAAVRQPLGTLAADMVRLTPESAARIIALSERSDGVGEVARAAITAFEKQDAAAEPAPLSPQADAMLREISRATDALRQAQNQMAQGIVAAADEIETLRQAVHSNHAQLADSLARTAMEALRTPMATPVPAPAVPAGLAAVGERLADVVTQLSRETQGLQSQRALLAAHVETIGKEHGATLRTLDQQARALGPEGHNIAAALIDIADRRLSFAATVESAHENAQRLDDLLKRLEARATAPSAHTAEAPLPALMAGGVTVADVDAMKAAIDGLAPKLDETLAGVKLLGRSLPEAAQLLTTSIEGVEAAVQDARAAIEDKIAARPASAPTESLANVPAEHPAIADISRTAELFQQVIAVNTASIAEFQTAFDNMRYDVNALRESFLPVVTDVQNTLDRSVEALAALERVSVDVSDVQKAVLPMVEEVKGAMDRTVEALAALERVSVDVGDVQKAILPMVSDVQGAMDRTVETLAALERVSADVERPMATQLPMAAPAPVQPLASIQPELDQAQKLLVGLRIVIRNLGDEVDVLREKVSAIEPPALADAPPAASEAALAPEAMAELAGRFDQIDQSLAALATKLSETAAPAPSVARSGDILAPMPDLGQEQMSFQRLLAGFRVLMRNISQESERLQASVSRLSQDADDIAGAAGPQSERLEKLIGGMGDMVAELGQRLRDAAHAPVAAAGRAPMGPHVFDAQQAGFERVLVGFRLLMRDLGQEADKLRGALSGVDALPATQGDGALIQRLDAQMSTLAGSFESLLGELEARVSSPLSVAAENIAFAVAETLSSLEQRLAEPVHQMADAARDCRALLAEVKQQLATAPAPVATVAAAPSSDPGQRIQDVTARLDRWIEQVDGTLGDLTQDLAASADASSPAVQRALDQRIAALGDLAAQMRKETSEFVAVGAAISRDLEEREAGEGPRRAAGGIGGLFPRRKK